MSKKSLSVVINTRNASKTLESCLESIKSLKADLVVVDMESTDNTLEIAKKYHARIFNHPNLDYADPARNFALEKATGDWILVLDADEEISPGLMSFIESVLTNPTEIDVYYLPRKNFIFKKWIKHSGWWPDYQARLFKNGHVKWETGVHKQPLVTDRSEEVGAKEDLAIIHFNYPTIESYLDRLQRYTTITAAEKKESISDEAMALVAIKTFKEEFFSRLFARDGIKDSSHGVVLSYLQAFYELSTKLKLWQRNGFVDKPISQIKILNELTLFRDDLSYWLADEQVKDSNGLKKIYWLIRRSWKV